MEALSYFLSTGVPRSVVRDLRPHTVDSQAVGSQWLRDPELVVAPRLLSALVTKLNHAKNAKRQGVGAEEHPWG